MTVGAVVLLYIVAPITLTIWLVCLLSYSQGHISPQQISGTEMKQYNNNYNNQQ